MNHQEKHQQKKQKEREQKNREEKAYEESQEKRRFPVSSIWLIVVGVVVTLAIVYVWIVSLARTPN